MRIPVGSLAVVLLASTGQAQTIDFETLPGGAPTVDKQTISTEYQSALGVSFELIDPLTGTHVGFPQIAKVGSPRTAFDSCEGADTPLPGQGIGESFLTDNQSLGVAGDLLITYSSPVASASGVILDVDCRSASGGPPCEQWTIEAIDAGGAVIDAAVIDGPAGPSQGTCVDGNGFGNSRSFGWAFSRAAADIVQIRLRYTGAASSVGLGFDLFSPSATAGPLSVDAVVPEAMCAGDRISLAGEASSGTPPYSFAWEQDDVGTWTQIASLAETSVQLFGDASFRFRVVDSEGAEQIVGPFTVVARPRRLIISQESAPGIGDFDANVLGEMMSFDAPGSLDAYYGWTSTNTPYQGPEPTLITDRSHLFSVIGTDGLGLFVVHDDATAGVGGRAEMRLEFVGVVPALAERDDTNDSYSVDDVAGTIRTRQTWNELFTDGFVVGPLAGEWTSFIQFSDEFTGAPTFDGLTSWFAYSDPAGGVELALVENRRVRIVTVCPACAADINRDGFVNGADLAALLAAWGTTTANADLNGDGAVDGADLAALLAAWGECD
jgi:hypothetical protein